MHRHAKWFAPVVAVLFGLTACEDPTTPPPGTPADVTIRAYVDADGSGDFSAGDPVISGASVTLTPTDGGQTHTATTDGSGVAQFSAVPPGSYVATLEGDVPAGAVMSGAERPVIVVPFQGGQIDAEFRFAYRPGTITGVVYRDDDASGVFDPDSDATAQGVEVSLYQGAEVGEEPLAVAVTDGDGRFHFDTLRPGTYTLHFSAPEPLEIVGDPIQTVTVAADAPTELSIQFVGDLVMTIENARARDEGSFVTVHGIVTVGQGTWRSDNAHVQDETAGILVFGLDPALGLQVGDSVEVSGTLGIHRGQLQITQPSATRLGAGQVPAPRMVTGAEIEARTYEGSLARANQLEVVAVSGSATSTAYNVTVRAADGTEFLVRVSGSGVGIEQPYWEVGATYSVIGALGSFDGAAQLLPRSAGDVWRTDEPMPIGAVRQLTDGETAVFVGVVTADQGVYDFQNRDTYVQDATGGIRLWQLSSDLGLETGDSVRVEGSLGTFRGERQFNVTEIAVLGTGTIPSPVEPSGADLLGMRHQGELGIVEVTVLEVNAFSFDAHNVVVRHADGTEFEIRVDSPNEIPSAYWEVGESYRVTGIIARFFETPQIKPRGFDDVEEL